jgi:aminoglycoside phosphotransferase (APT) family kinase protein
MDFTDQAKQIRAGERLEETRVEEFLKANIPDLDGEINLLQFPSGHSNLTYLVVFKDREYVLRRPPMGTKAKTAHDMGREYKILKALKPVYPYCPDPIIFCEDTSIMGSSFYIMERVRGIILRKDLPHGLQYSPDNAAILCKNLINVQFMLHTIDYKKIGLSDFGKPTGYVKRQVEGWSLRYRHSKTPDAPGFELVMSWLSENMPPDNPGPGVVHNDFKLDNVVLDPADPLNIIGVLDWEMATIGDPLMDLGNSLAYWIQMDDPPEMQAIRLMPTNMKGALTRKELLHYYQYLSGSKIENFHFYYCFGLFRLAVIAQQIYYRFFHGQTRDERFKMLIFAVAILETAAEKVIKTSFF